MQLNAMNALRARGVGGGIASEGTALIGDVRNPKTFINSSGEVLVGTLVTRDAGGPIAVTPGTATQTLQAGIYDNPISIAGDDDLVSSKVPVGVTMFGVVGTYTSDADAVAVHILATKTAYINGVKVTGTMPNRSGVTSAQSGTVNIVAIASNSLTMAIPADLVGYVDQTTRLVQGINNLSAVNIKAGIQVGSATQYLTGTFTADANAVAGDMLAGKTGYVNGVKVTGTMPNYDNLEPDALIAPYMYAGAIYMKPPQGYYDGDLSRVKYAAPNHLAAHIKAGITDLGVTGTFTSDADAVASEILTGKTAYVNGVKLTGTLIPKPDLTIGNSADGVFNSTGNVTWTVSNQNAVMIKQFSSFTLNAGHTLTLDKTVPLLVILVNGTLTLNGVMNFDGLGNYYEIDLDTVRTALPSYYFGRLPIPKNGAGGNGGTGGSYRIDTGSPWNGGFSGGVGGKPYYVPTGVFPNNSRYGEGGGDAGKAGGSTYAAGGGTSKYNGTGAGGGAGGGNGVGSGANASNKVAGLNVIIFARAISIGTTGRIYTRGSAGGAGGNSDNTNSGAGGGAGGNGGGGIDIYYRDSFTNSGSMDTSGGAYGAGGSANGVYFTGGSNGVAGTAGTIQTLQV